MTTPSETATDQMTAEDDAVMPSEAAMSQSAAENEAGMLERVPAPAGPPPAENPGFPAASAAVSPGPRWHEIRAMFVDDPRASAEMAASLVENSVQALVAGVREQQDSLRAAWHGENAGTEELRAAVQQYHAFGDRLTELTRKI